MIRVSMTELRRHLESVLARVGEGDVFEVTRRGKPVLRIEPVVGRPPTRPFAEVRDWIYSPVNLPVSSTDLLRDDRDRR